MVNWKHVILGGVVAGGLAVVIKVSLAKHNLRANQERADRAAQFEIWMDFFQAYLRGEPQPVNAPATIEQDPLKLQQMRDEAIRLIEEYRRDVANDLH